MTFLDDAPKSYVLTTSHSEYAKHTCKSHATSPENSLCFVVK